MKKLQVIGLLLCALLLVAAPASAKEAKKDAAKGKTPPAGVLGRVGTEFITEQEVEDILERTSPKGRAPDSQRRVVQDMVEVLVFAQEGRKAGLLEDPEVKKRLREATMLILARTFFNKYVADKAQADDELALQEYEKKKEGLVSAEQMHVQHILVKEKAEAEKVLARLKKGEAFEEVAKQESKDPMSGRKGGDLGWQSRGTLDPSFEKAAAALKPGELSQPIQTRYGWHIIKLVERKEKRQLTFDEVKEALKDGLKREAVDKLRKDYVDKADVEIYMPKEPAPTEAPASKEEAPAPHGGMAPAPPGGMAPAPPGGVAPAPTTAD